MKKRIFISTFLLLSLLGCSSGNMKDIKSGVGVITVLPNQTAFAEVVLENDEVAEVNQIKEGGNISFKLSGMDDGMMLSGKNMLNVAIKYDIYMVDYNGKKHYTSSCPMMAGVGVFESWPHNIPKISIENFRVVPPNGDMACR